MGLEIEDLREQLDNLTKVIIFGLENRQDYLLNEGVFNKEFAQGKTWISERLVGDQNVDATFGRFDFEDQHPILCKKEELNKSRIKRDIPKIGLAPVDINFGEKVLELYKNFLPFICKPGEQPEKYGEVVKLDSSNISTLYERILGIGKEVGEFKLRQDSSLLEAKTAEEIKFKLHKPDREREVLYKTVKIAKRYHLMDPNVMDDPKLGIVRKLIRADTIKEYFKGIMGLTIDVEVAYIQEIQKQEALRKPYIIKYRPSKDTPEITYSNGTAPGFGQTGDKSSNTGWGTPITRKR